MFEHTIKKPRERLKNLRLVDHETLQVQYWLQIAQDQAVTTEGWVGQYQLDLAHRLSESLHYQIVMGDTALTNDDVVTEWQ